MKLLWPEQQFLLSERLKNWVIKEEQYHVYQVKVMNKWMKQMEQSTFWWQKSRRKRLMMKWLNEMKHTLLEDRDMSTTLWTTFESYKWMERKRNVTSFIPKVKHLTVNFKRKQISEVFCNWQMKPFQNNSGTTFIGNVITNDNENLNLQLFKYIASLWNKRWKLKLTYSLL